MKGQNKYPEEFTGLLNRQYKLIKIYDNFALYEEKRGWKTCYNLETIRAELRRVAYDDSRRTIQV